MKIFLSHASEDKPLVDDLRRALELRGCRGWLDARELRGGDVLPTELEQAIATADAFALFVSPASLQSKWVGIELEHALAAQAKSREAGQDFRVVPLCVDATKLGVLERFFEAEPIHVAVSSKPGGVEAAIPKIEEALGVALPQIRTETPATPDAPQEELVLELTRPDFFEEEGKKRGRAEAKLIYEPSDPGKRRVDSAPFTFTAPLGPIELEELRWYLEDYAVWPGGYVEEKARRIEKQLEQWGQDLYDAAVPSNSVREVLNGWAKIDADAVRRFSVHVDKRLPTGCQEERVEIATEAATALLGLPWELLHDGKAFLFQGRKPVRVRRRLPNTREYDGATVGLPIRILLVSPRPEDEACSYIDHRVSAEPLVRAVESLGGMVELELLDPPTFPALTKELERAKNAKEPYHVVHFDGHGIYSKKEGLGGLCFEDPRDARKLRKRRHETIYTEALGSALRDYRIPLVFLEACQTAQADEASGSVASELLEAGVASVVAMSHSVLVETAWRFVETFYESLSQGKRVADAMLAGQRRLHDESFRLRTFTGDLHLQDWFVPVLFQEELDPQLFEVVPSESAQEVTAEALEERLGLLPAVPGTGFIGRSRALLALERLLGEERYAVIRGQGGEGKTTLATELARWLVRSKRFDRAAFVSVEGLEVEPARAVLDAIGRQLLPADNYAVAEYGDDLEAALKPVERALGEQSTILVMDNLESLLPAPWMQQDEALVADSLQDLGKVLELCGHLQAIGATRIVFTTREALPQPFAEERNRIELGRLERADAVRFVERVLDEDWVEPEQGEEATHDVPKASREAIEDLVDAVQGHARTLSLLAPSLREVGVEETQAQLTSLMQRMHAEHPDSREQSLFASVELSLRRLSPINRERVHALGVFQGAADLNVLRMMMNWEPDDVELLATELVESGLATRGPYAHLHLHPALCPFLYSALSRPSGKPTEDATLQSRRSIKESDSAQLPSGAHVGLAELEDLWAATMEDFIRFLTVEGGKDAQLAATLAVLELPNAMALLDRVASREDAEATIALTTCLYQLVRELGRPRILAKIAAQRDAATRALDSNEWSHALFEAERTRVEQQLAAGRFSDASRAARRLHERALAAGETAYGSANYDLAGSFFLLGRSLEMSGAASQAIPLLQEAQRRFEVIAESQANGSAAEMAAAALVDQGRCHLVMRQLDTAVAVYKETIERAERRGARRAIATSRFQLGTVRLLQRRFTDALAVYEEARATFEALGEPLAVATVWHQIAMVHQEAERPEPAETAYRKSLAIRTREGDQAGQADSLIQLGNLHLIVLRKPEEAAAFYGQSAEKFQRLNDPAGEGSSRTNLAMALYELRRFDEARNEIRRAITCMEPFSQSLQVWKTWATRHDLESACGNDEEAAEARSKALDLYLAYRRQGGEEPSRAGRLCQAVTASMLGQSPNAQSIAEMKSDLRRIRSENDSWEPLIHVLLQILDGSRDRTLADSAELHYQEAVEVHVLLDALDSHESGV